MNLHIDILGEVREMLIFQKTANTADFYTSQYSNSQPYFNVICEQTSKSCRLPITTRLMLGNSASNVLVCISEDSKILTNQGQKAN